jgi:hypothetical protein
MITGNELINSVGASGCLPSSENNSVGANGIRPIPNKENVDEGKCRLPLQGKFKINV